VKEGKKPAAAGCAIYDGGTWPAEYNGDYFTTEPTINIIHHARLTPQGSSYTFHKLPGREETEFVRSRDMWWRPIEARVGPDGALYIADFYNQAVIHNDTRGPDHNKVNAAVRPDRDHYFGRIWKIDHKDAKKIAVPDLSKAGEIALLAGLKHPNRHVRMTASRLIVEQGLNLGNATNTMDKFISQNGDEAKVAGIWTLAREGSSFIPIGMPQRKPSAVELQAALLSLESLRMEKHSEDEHVAGANEALAIASLSHESAGVRVAALRAIAALDDLSPEVAEAIVTAWPKFDDDYQKSAAVGAMANRTGGIKAILHSSSSDASLSQLAANLTQIIAEKNDADAAARLVVALAEKPASADALKRGILDTLGTSLKTEPAMTPELSSALGKLLASGASASTLPLAAKWDKAGALKGEVAKLTASLLANLAEDSEASREEERVTVARNLLGLRESDPKILPAITAYLGKGRLTFQRGLISALGETGAKQVGPAIAAAYDKLPADAQAAAFDTLLKRPEWAIALLDAVKAKTVSLTNLGPASLNRLRTHPDRGVSRRATDLLNELNPTAKVKKEIIEKLMAGIEQKGDAAKGKALFATACAICHKFGDVGADIGPGLTGMGAHGAGELLSAIVDPNAEVDPSFTQWNIETKDGQAFAGIIAAENPTSVTMKSLAGVQEIKTAAIRSRVN
ncbi:MAG: c-type cytochrome, partial [Chthoniobacteraceae bacterium]